MVNELKQLIKQHKKIEIEIKHLTKLRLNDRTSTSWEKLRQLKKEKLNLKEKISDIKNYFLMKERRTRSIIKTLTWRVTASLDTFLISWIITGSYILGGSIAGVEILTKMFLYYFHERIWNKLTWGRNENTKRFI